jgi:hypothetical protein
MEKHVLLFFYVLSFKILKKKTTIILPCGTGAPQWRKLRREEEVVVTRCTFVKRFTDFKDRQGNEQKHIAVHQI